MSNVCLLYISINAVCDMSAAQCVFVCARYFFIAFFDACSSVSSLNLMISSLILLSYILSLASLLRSILYFVYDRCRFNHH